MVAEMLMPSLVKVALQASEVNCAPLSDVTVNGTPYLATQVSRNVLTTISAVVSAIGTASGHRVVLSTIVNK